MSIYISITDLCNISYNNRSFNVYCKSQGHNLLKKYNCKKQTEKYIYDTQQMLMNKGINFENNVCKYIRNKFSNIKIEEFDYKDCRTEEGRQKMRFRMIDYIRQQRPIIFQAYLWDTDLQIHGYADLILRNDIIVQLFDNSNLPNNFQKLHKEAVLKGKYFYVLIDVKCKNVKVGNFDNFPIRDIKSKHEDYCFQVTAYYNMLKKITGKDLLIPEFSCILGRKVCIDKTSTKTNGCFKAMAFISHTGKNYKKLSNKIKQNVKICNDMKANGHKWDIRDKSFKQFIPKNDQNYYPYNNLKKRIIYELNPYKSEIDDVISFTQKLFIRKQDNKRLSNVQFTINLDLEFLDSYHVDDFRDFPNIYGFSCIYIIGLTVYEGNELLENKQFIMNELTQEEQYNVCKEFSNYIEKLTDNYKKNFIILHWSHAEKTQFKTFMKEEPKHDQLSFFNNFEMIEKNNFFDLMILFKGNKELNIPEITLPKKPGYSIKTVLKLCKKYGLTKLDWEDNEMDGKNTICAALMYYSDPINYSHIMEIISHYNTIDCDAMWKLRNILLKYTLINIHIQ